MARRVSIRPLPTSPLTTLHEWIIVRTESYAKSSFPDLSDATIAPAGRVQFNTIHDRGDIVNSHYAGNVCATCLCTPAPLTGTQWVEPRDVPECLGEISVLGRVTRLGVCGSPWFSTGM